MNLRHACSQFLAIASFLGAAGAALAQPIIVSVVPGRGASSVPSSTTIKFTFSDSMNPDFTTASFVAFKGTDIKPVDVTPVWTLSDTVLTCTPTAALPEGYTVFWSVEGEDALGIPMDGDFDSFTVAGGGSSGTGCDPLAPMGSFTVSKGWLYLQNSSGSPVLDGGNPYCFLACTTIPCPTGATNATLKIPSAATYNLNGTGNPGHLQRLDCSFPSPAALDAAYSAGSYLFTVQAVLSNQVVPVNFPGTLTQPEAPHVSNWSAAQAINPSQPFTLSWDPMVGGSAADCIYVEIYGGIFKTPALSEPGALNGTATSVVIPANTLQPNQTYQGSITFYHYQIVSNGNAYVTLAYRGSATEFSISTVSGAGSSLSLANSAVVTGTGKFMFDVNCLLGQFVIVERSSTLLTNSWTPILVTNTTTTSFRVTDDLAPDKRFYRARLGP